jgi:hypothetical protein
MCLERRDNLIGCKQSKLPPAFRNKISIALDDDNDGDVWSNT